MGWAGKCKKKGVFRLGIRLSITESPASVFPLMPIKSRISGGENRLQGPAREGNHLVRAQLSLAPSGVMMPFVALAQLEKTQIVRCNSPDMRPARTPVLQNLYLQDQRLEPAGDDLSALAELVNLN